MFKLLPTSFACIGSNRPRLWTKFSLLLVGLLGIGESPLQAQALIRSQSGFAHEEHFGGAVEALGDVDGDDVADYAIGAPAFDGPGSVRVFSGLSGQMLYRVFGGEPVGRDIQRMDDLDGDGIDDFVALEYDWDGSQSGPVVRAFSGVDGQALYVVPFWGGFVPQEVDASLSLLSDVDGDGISDVAIISRPYSKSTSQLHVFSGVDGHTLWAQDDFNRPGRQMHFRPVSVIDMDGDSLLDIGVARSWWTPGQQNSGGSEYVFLSGLSGALISTWSGPGSYLHELHHDYDGDGVDEFLVPVRPDTGNDYFKVISGRVGMPDIMRVEFVGTSAPQIWTTGVDVTGDGVPDVITSESVLSGVDLSRTYLARAADGEPRGAYVGDIDGDGIHDGLQGFAGESGPFGQHQGLAILSKGRPEQTCFEETTGSGTHGQSQFGGAVSVSRGRAAVGSIGDDSNDGAAYIYELGLDGNWLESARLSPPVPGQAGKFGWDVAVQGNVCVVGAPFEAAQGGAVQEAGAAYVFRLANGTWSLEQRLQPTGLTDNAHFGLSVDYMGGKLAVGAPLLEVQGSSQVGSAFVYGRQGASWILEEQMFPETLSSNQLFGTSVALFGDRLAVGAPYEDDVFVNQGGAYVFQRLVNSTWVQEQHLHSPSPGASEFYGIAVDLWLDDLLVGEEYHDHYGPRSGTAHVYTLDVTAGGWNFGQSLVPSTGGSNDTFGNAVSMAEGELIISARGHALAGPVTGTAFVFNKSPDTGLWTESRRLTASNAQVGDILGSDVGISFGRALVGVMGRDGSGQGAVQQGAVLFVNVSQEDCNGNGEPDACDVINGTSSDCNGNGTPDECDIANGIDEDCNSNGIPDSCDITNGTSTDCNANGIPDECDLASGFASDCNGNGIIDACDLLSGFSQDLNSNGTLDECEGLGVTYCSPATANSAVSTGAVITAIGSGIAADNDMLVFVADLPLHQTTLLISGDASGFVPFPGGSQGILCIGGNIGRHKSQVTFSGPTGTVTIPVDLTSMPVPTGTTMVLKGDTYFFQTWYRDMSPQGSVNNFSDAIEITFQ